MTLTHNERVLRLLSDGKPHSHHELYALHVIAHSRISDLRRQGHTIEQWRDGDNYIYRLRLLEAGSGHARRGTTASASSLEQPVPPVTIPPAAPLPAPGWLGEPAPSPTSGGAASGGTHPSCGTGSGLDSGDTAAGRASWCAAGNGTTCPASPEQLSIEDALTERGTWSLDERSSPTRRAAGLNPAPDSPRSVSAEVAA